MSDFIRTPIGAVNKKFVSGVTKCKGKRPWNGQEYFCICIHLQGTVAEIEYDNRLERNQEFEGLLRELDNSN